MQVHTFGNQTQNISLQTGPDHFGMESHLARQQSTVSGNLFITLKKASNVPKEASPPETEKY